MSYQFHTLAAGLTNGVRRDDPSVLGAEFPERPDALRRFLKGLQHSGWNIALFHYRNHGAGACYMHLSMQVYLSYELCTRYRHWEGAGGHPGPPGRY